MPFNVRCYEIFMILNDWIWPNFPIHTSAKLWHSQDFERQDSGQIQTWRLIRYKHPLTGGSRPNPDLQSFGLHVVFVLFSGLLI